VVIGGVKGVRNHYVLVPGTFYFFLFLRPGFAPFTTSLVGRSATAGIPRKAFWREVENTLKKKRAR
jgi:hypothetical protein